MILGIVSAVAGYAALDGICGILAAKGLAGFGSPKIRLARGVLKVGKKLMKTVRKEPWNKSASDDLNAWLAEVGAKTPKDVGL